MPTNFDDFHQPKALRPKLPSPPPVATPKYALAHAPKMGGGLISGPYDTEEECLEMVGSTDECIVRIYPTDIPDEVRWVWSDERGGWERYQPHYPKTAKIMLRHFDPTLYYIGCRNETSQNFLAMTEGFPTLAEALKYPGDPARNMIVTGIPGDPTRATVEALWDPDLETWKRTR